MTFNKIKMAIYSTILTNYYGFKLTKFKKFSDKKKLRIEYSTKLLNKLNIKIKVVNE
ncbi:MAG TPA: 1-acyl-sn-glycerol-3-phosphate acyltransferase, partial [Sulfurimonas sp. UBA10385]